ncbi:hypothetical protein RY831_16375 [Noviherbaspirillum sp. CPCC 100848]|uniref:Type III secretion chaperone SycN n=1 Tax=Noviherbaspirillum album TaxID=3080276 RepID=A0ABU6JBD2_9BURK|nr:hypothetical protein [Noviherbaspirillum sp. CPCC 100848]MEC4720741.1 hypothetical protein [Noviherbaspirillum sp. CPCC 100848]
MHWVQQTLADFGKSLGMDGLSFSEQGMASLQFQSGSQLGVELVNEEVLVYRIQPTPFPSPELRGKVLRQADFRQGGQFPFQVGMKGVGQEAVLVVLVRVPVRDFTLPMLERVINGLNSRWVDLA